MSAIRPTVSTSTSKLAGMLDANVYATKKTIAQGMLDVALLTANASQLKYLLQVGKAHEFYYLMMSLICVSIILQVLIGAVLLLKSRYSINIEEHQKAADVLNNLLVWMIFAVTVLNIFVSALGLEYLPVNSMAGQLKDNSSATPKPAPST